MEKIMLSIVVPVYNVEKFLDQCIQSILSQTYTYFELLLIDDGSVDNSLDICKKYKEEDDRIKLFSIENHGVSYVRNLGISKSNGRYIIFIDSDDYVDVRFIEDMIKNTSDYDFVSCGYVRFNETAQVKVLYNRKKKIKKRYIYINYCRNSTVFNQLWNKVYRLDVIKNNNILFDENVKIGEDLLFNIQYMDHIKSGYFIKEEYYHYRINNNSAMSKNGKERISNNDILLFNKLFCLQNSIRNKELKKSCFLLMTALAFTLKQKQCKENHIIEFYRKNRLTYLVSKNCGKKIKIQMIKDLLIKE